MPGRKDKKRKKTNVGSETDISTDFSTFADNSFSVNELLTRISTLEGDVFEIVAENKKLKSELKKQNDELNTLKSGLEREKSRCDFLNKSVNNLEQYTRLNNIRIYGLQDTNPKETSFQCEQKVLSLLRNKLAVNLKPNDIEASHRLGKFMKEGNRPTIVRFVSRKHKDECISNRYKLKGHSEVLVEDLTINNHIKLREVKNLENVQQAWSRDGKLMVKTFEQDRIFSVPWNGDPLEHISKITASNPNAARGSYFLGSPHVRGGAQRGAGSFRGGTYRGRGGVAGGSGGVASGDVARGGRGAARGGVARGGRGAARGSGGVALGDGGVTVGGATGGAGGVALGRGRGATGAWGAAADSGDVDDREHPSNGDTAGDDAASQGDGKVSTEDAHLSKKVTSTPVITKYYRKVDFTNSEDASA